MRTDRCVRRTSIGRFQLRHRDYRSHGAGENECPPRAAASWSRWPRATALHCHRFEGRVPGPGRGVIDRGDSVADSLPVAVDQSYIDGKIDTRAGHDLPLERIAMQIDDARQHL